MPGFNLILIMTTESFKVSWSMDGSIRPDQRGESLPMVALSHAQAEARRIAHKPGRSPKCVTILRASDDFPENAGVYFLHSIVK